MCFFWGGPFLWGKWGTSIAGWFLRDHPLHNSPFSMSSSQLGRTKSPMFYEPSRITREEESCHSWKLQPFMGYTHVFFYIINYNDSKISNLGKIPCFFDYIINYFWSYNNEIRAINYERSIETQSDFFRSQKLTDLTSIPSPANRDWHLVRGS